MKIARIINNKKNPAFDLIFSVEPKTLQEVTPKFETSFLFSESQRIGFSFIYYIFNYLYLFNFNML